MYLTYQKGEIAQLKVQLRAAQLGVLVSKPTIEARYDLILDTGNRLERAQVKYVDCWRGAAAHLDLRKETRNNGKVRLYGAEEIDAIYAYIPKWETIVRFCPEQFHQKKSITFRMDSPKRMLQNVLMAHQFVW